MTSLSVLALLLAAPPPTVTVPPPTPEAVAFHWGSNALWIVNQVLAVGLPLLILATGLHVRLRDIAMRLTRGYRTPAAALMAVGMLGLLALVAWPLRVYQSYWRLHAYGLSNQTFLRWLSHWAMGLGIAMVIGGIVAAVVYALLRRFPRRWWLAAGLLALPFLVFGALVMPVLVDPLFNRQTRLSDPALEARILSLAHRAGIEADRVFEEDKSRDTKALNAYVKGLFQTRRIVLWDTLLGRMDEDQILFVMGHEMGHYVLGHVAQGLVMATGLILIGLAFVHVAATAIVRCWPWLLPPPVEATIATSLPPPLRGRSSAQRTGGGWSGDEVESSPPTPALPHKGGESPYGMGKFLSNPLSDLASLPLLLALAQVAALVLSPVGYAFSRHMEHEADRFALELTRDNHNGALTFLTFQSENLGVPRPAPLYRVCRASHPCLADRVAFCNSYRPWDEGRPLRYGSRFRAEPEPPR